VSLTQQSCLAVWQSVVAHQISLVGRKLPATLRGGIRFESQGAQRPFFLWLNGPATAFVANLEHPETTVSIDEAALADALRGRACARPVFEVSGDSILFNTLFSELKRLSVPTSSLSVREIRLQPRGF
jgi:hypothetical protein